MQNGFLSIVGTGMVVPDHLTDRALTAIRDADWVGHVLDDSQKITFIDALRNQAQSENLSKIYQAGTFRQETYARMVERVMEMATDGRRACLVSYGDPLFYCMPSEWAIDKSHEVGLPVTVIPSISSQDCLLADLAVDVADHGYVAMEANDLTTFEFSLDPTVGLILMQITMVGEFSTFKEPAAYRGYLQLLGRLLCRYYKPEHPAYAYSAANTVGQAPVICATTVSQLHEATYQPYSTLYIPPIGAFVPPGLKYPDTHLPGAAPTPDYPQVRLVGLGEEAPTLMTVGAQRHIEEATRVFYVDLGGAGLAALLKIRADAQPWSEYADIKDGQTVICCSGHPCFSDPAMQLIRDGLICFIEPAVSLDRVVSRERSLESFIHGYQVRTARQLVKYSALDLHHTSLFLADSDLDLPEIVRTLPDRELSRFNAHSFFLKGSTRPAAAAKIAEDAHFARAPENFRRELGGLPEKARRFLPSILDPKSEDAHLVMTMRDYFKKQVFQVAAKNNIDLSVPEAFAEIERHPETELAIFCRLFHWSTQVELALRRDNYSMAAIREMVVRH